MCLQRSQTCGEEEVHNKDNINDAEVAKKYYGNCLVYYYKILGIVCVTTTVVRIINSMVSSAIWN